MSWFYAGAAAVTVVAGVVQQGSAASASAKSAGQLSLAEGQAVVKERLNTTIRNSYNTALQQSQLALQKRQLSGQSNAIGAAGLQAAGDVAVGAAATGSEGASIDAIAADVQMKTQTAMDMTSDAFENAVENYNSALDLMVINTEQSESSVRQAQYNGPSSGAVLGGAILGGLSTFASGYATRQMSLGLNKGA